MRVEIRLFGGFEVVVDGARVPDASWSRRQSAALVKLLALSPGHRLLRDQVIDALWPDLTVDAAAPRLHKAAHYARAALGDRQALVVSGETIALFPDAEVGVDVDRFDALAEAASGIHADQDQAASDAVALYRGDLLPEDLYEPWAEQPRDTRRLRYLELLRQQGRWAELLAAEPVDEEAHLRLAQQHLERGDGAAALRQLDRMAEVLERELGVPPGEAAAALRHEATAMAAVDLSRRSRMDTQSRLPRPPTPTIGREADVSELLDTLDESRFVTLLGPGGVGKTRLAVEVALRWGETTEGEAAFMDLTKVADAGLVPDLIVRELGLRIDRAGDAHRVLEEALRGRSMLIVLDNFEHVLDAAPIVNQLTDCSAGIRVLSTSRARLHVAGERVFDVTPLDVEAPASSDSGHDDLADAIALFAQSATAADPTFRLEPHIADVDGICRTVDGLPLAIELAAGHVRTLPPPLLRARLRARLESPTGAPRGMPRRQQTIPATIDWSLQLLDEAERSLFARLGVFAGAVPLDAIEQVCSEPGVDTIDTLSRLVDHCLVRRVAGSSGEVLFSMLELLREHARNLLVESGEGLAMSARHAEYVAAFLDDLDERRWTEVADRWIALISEMYGEIRTAHAWAERNDQTRLADRITAGLGTFWHREGHHAEGREWVAAALSHEVRDDDTLAARLDLTAGFLEWPRDQLVAREHWTRAIERFRALGHDRYLAYSLALASGTYVADEEAYPEALELCNEGIALARKVGERPLIAQALNVLGELSRVHGDDELALAVYTEGLDLAATAKDDAHISVFLANLSYLADHRGDYEESLRLGHEALRTSWSLGRRMMAAWTLSELAGPELGLGRAERGARLIGAADHALGILQVTRHPGDRSEHERVLAGLRGALGEDEFRRLRAEGARLSLEEAVDLALS